MSDMPERSKMRLREVQKDERRKHLVRTARKLLENEETSGFSMPDLAQHAGVSLATPYNLFGSKAEILQAVFEVDVAGLHRQIAQHGGDDPVGELLATATRLAHTLSSRASYYHALARSLSDLGRAEMHRLINPLSESLLAPSVQAIHEQGLLRPTLPPSAVAVLLTRQFEMVFVHWSLMQWDEARLAVELQIAIGGTMVGFLEDAARSRVEGVLSELNYLPSDQFCYNAL
jgi:AcrR family transcriptional regulator